MPRDCLAEALSSHDSQELNGHPMRRIGLGQSWLQPKARNQKRLRRLMRNFNPRPALNLDSLAAHDGGPPEPETPRKPPLPGSGRDAVSLPAAVTSPAPRLALRRVSGEDHAKLKGDPFVASLPPSHPPHSADSVEAKVWKRGFAADFCSADCCVQVAAGGWGCPNYPPVKPYI